MKEQKVITIFKDLGANLDMFDLDAETKKLNSDGWEIVQIVSTSFLREKHEINSQKSNRPFIALSLLISKF